MHGMRGLAQAALRLYDTPITTFDAIGRAA